MSECTHDCSSCSHNCSSRSSGCSGDCGSCGGGCGGQQPADFHEPSHPLSHIKHVIGVVSGKGGVGKSLVTSSLAVAMAKKGYKVGILDADITGPSIPKAFGIHTHAEGSEFGMYPVSTPSGIQVMSLNLLTENETDPVVWRGPVISGLVKQFWTEVIWGEVDYLFVDMPPGTGDVPLTVFQTLPVDGIVVVTSPQELVGMIVAKAVKMANLMDIPVLGFVENFSCFKCPDCGKTYPIFGESHIDDLAANNALPVLAKLPIDPVLASAVDKGQIESCPVNYLTEAVDYIDQKVNAADAE